MGPPLTSPCDYHSRRPIRRNFWLPHESPPLRNNGSGCVNLKRLRICVTREYRVRRCEVWSIRYAASGTRMLQIGADQSGAARLADLNMCVFRIHVGRCRFVAKWPLRARIWAAVGPMAKERQD